MKPRLTSVLLSALSFGAALIVSANVAQAESNTAARVSATIKPCFGALLDAPIHCGYGGRKKVGTDYRYQYKKKGHHYGYHGKPVGAAVVDCDRHSAAYIEGVAARVRSGGVLRIKARNRSCTVSLTLTRSITVIGEGYGPDQMPVIRAPIGQPCIRIAPTADQVVLKDLSLESRRGEGTSCIESSGSELTIQSSLIRYEGDAPAVKVSGGRLVLNEGTHIIARTRTAAVDVRNAALFAEQSSIASTASGLYGVLSDDSEIQGVSILQLADWHGFERGRGAVGVDLRLDRGDSILTLTNLDISHFTNGMVLTGSGEALLAHSKIEGADQGLSAGLNRVRIIDNVIVAKEIAINVTAGTAYIGRNQLAGMRTAGILASSRGEIRAVDNMIDPLETGCQTLRWGELPPEQRICTPWYRGSEFDLPADGHQFMFDSYPPRPARLTTAEIPEDSAAVPASAPSPASE